MTKWFKRMVRDLIDDCSGTAAVEYAVIAALISVAAISVLDPVGSGVSQIFDSVCTEISGVSGVSITCPS